MLLYPKPSFGPPFSALFFLYRRSARPRALMRSGYCWIRCADRRFNQTGRKDRVSDLKYNRLSMAPEFTNVIPKFVIPTAKWNGAQSSWSHKNVCETIPRSCHPSTSAHLGMTARGRGGHDLEAGAADVSRKAPLLDSLCDLGCAFGCQRPPITLTAAPPKCANDETRLIPNLSLIDARAGREKSRWISTIGLAWRWRN